VRDRERESGTQRAAGGRTLSAGEGEKISRKSEKLASSPGERVYPGGSKKPAGSPGGVGTENADPGKNRNSPHRRNIIQLWKVNASASCCSAYSAAWRPAQTSGQEAACAVPRREGGRTHKERRRGRSGVCVVVGVETVQLQPENRSHSHSP
jgi:hypothetical protein